LQHELAAVVDEEELRCRARIEKRHAHAGARDG
jgi:hypothetical protein